MTIQKFKSSHLILIFLVAILYCQCKSTKQLTEHVEISNEVVELKILPSLTDSTIKNTDVAHFIKYNPFTAKGKLLLFLPGTNGIPERGPQKLFDVAIEQGCSVINLSYINAQAVARICKGENLENDPDCTSKFRSQRIFGTQNMTFIPDEPQDAIVNRLVKLLAHLIKINPEGNWDNYLDLGKPNWNNIIVAGQSQGGGMAAFIAKERKVKRIITFSGGWDYSAKNKIANWYYTSSITPPDRWYGIYHSKEPKAADIDSSYRAMAIPEHHIFALDLEIREGKKAHGEGIRNVVYKEMWKDLFE